jgi:hypothetical protein
MKYTLSKDKLPSTYWNGMKALPDTIHVISHQMHMAELELLTMICTLHGHVTAFDILTGAEPSSEKDTDLNSVLSAFQQYIYPKMPLSHYTGSDQRNPQHSMKQKPIESLS